MDYKKLVSLLAVSSFALAACETDEEVSPDPEIVDEAEDDLEGVEDIEEDTTGEELVDEDEESPMDIIDDIEGDLDYTLPIELTVVGGTWSQDGYVFTPADGEAVISASAVPVDEETEVYAYVLEEGEVIAEPEVVEGEFSYTVTATEEDQEFQVGVADEDLWEVGDTADPEELVRYEDIIVLAPPVE